MANAYRTPSIPITLELSQADLERAAAMEPAGTRGTTEARDETIRRALNVGLSVMEDHRERSDKLERRLKS